MGAAITTEFNHPNSFISIRNNLFFRNKATMAAGINVIHLRGGIEIIENIFCENVAASKTYVLVGAGSAFLIAGSIDTIVISSGNVYIYNQMEYCGLKIKLYYINNYKKL